MPVPLALPIIAGAGALFNMGGSLFAGSEAARAQKRLEELRDQENRRFVHDSSINFLDTDAAKSTLATLRRQNKKQTEIIDNNAVKQGLSDEAQVSQASRLNENYAEAANRLAGLGTQYNQQLKDSHYRRLNSLDNALYNSQLGRASSLGSLGQSISGLTGAAMSAYSSGAFDKSYTPGDIWKSSPMINTSQLPKPGDAFSKGVSINSGFLRYGN